jgi:hypothetical protein
MAERTDPTAHILDRKRKNRALLHMMNDGRISKEEAAPWFRKDKVAAAREALLKQEKDAKRRWQEENRTKRRTGDKSWCPIWGKIRQEMGITQRVIEPVDRGAVPRAGAVPAPSTPPVIDLRFGGDPEEDGAESRSDRCGGSSSEDDNWGVWRDPSVQEEGMAERAWCQAWSQPWSEDGPGHRNAVRRCQQDWPSSEYLRMRAKEERDAQGTSWVSLTSAGTPQRKGEGKGGSWGEPVPCGRSTVTEYKPKECPIASKAFSRADVDQKFATGYFRKLPFTSDVMTINWGSHVLWKSAGVGKNGGPSTKVEYFHGMCQGWKDNRTVIIC